MKQSVNSPHRRTTSAGIIITCSLLCCLIGIAATHKEKEPLTEELFDHGLYTALKTEEKAGIHELAQDYELRQFFWVPVLVPDPDFVNVLNVGSIVFKSTPDILTRSFLKGLVPQQTGTTAVYPVTVREDRVTRERVFYNAIGEEIAAAPCPNDYDPTWHAFERYPDLLQKTRAEIDHILAVFDPARVVVKYDIILEQDLVRYVLGRSLQATAPDLGGGTVMMGMGWEGGSVTNIEFTAIAGTNGIEMTIVYPDDFTNQLDIFARTNLMVQDWELVLTTNVDLFTNWIAWADPGFTSYGIRFYDAWNADYDSDDDSLSDGRENRIYGTDPDDPDTDGDRVLDGADPNPLSAADTDTDGMADDWETYWSGGITNWSGADDPDGDGWTNAFEYVHGLCPTNAETPLGDEDGDRYPNIYEIQHGTLCLHAWDVPSPTITVTNGGGVSIQQAIDAATNDYDIVLVLSGTYTNSGDRNLDFAGKKAMLISESDSTDTVIDCGGSGRGLYFHTSESNETIVSGFTVTGGNTNDGGGIYCSTSSPAIQNCVIVGNAAQNGGGVYCLASAPLIRNCSVLTNTADNGGGIHLSGSSPRIEHCLLEGNTGGTSVSGGGLDTDSHYCYYSDWPDPLKSRSIGSSPVVSNCTFRNNDAPGGGNIRVADRNPALDGTLDPADWQQGEPRFYACTISDAGDAGNWSVIIGTRPSVVFENCAVVNNSCGGIYNQGGDVTVQNCTFAYSVGTYYGAGVSAFHPSSNWGSTTIRNAIVYGNEPQTYQIFAVIDNELCTVDYSCYDPTEHEYVNNHVVYGANNTTNPPMLSRSGHIRSTSPCIDAGDSASAPPDDIDGEDRGGSVDMGCDEFVDVDGDTMPDWWERTYGFDPDSSNSPAANPDGDELSNLQEYVATTDPLTASGDTDGDGLSDDAEAYYWTDPDYWDSDDDLRGDGWEVAYGFDPAVSNDAATNSDGDAWTDIEEADQGTDPTDSDTDGDGVADDQDADPHDDGNDAVADATNTTDMVLFVGDRSGSHSERYKVVVGPFSLYMSHVSDQEYEFSKTVRVPRNKTYSGYLESLSDDDEDGDYDADVTGSGISVDDPWLSDASGRVLGGHHENSGFNSGQRTFTVTVAEHACDEETADATKPGIPESESKDPINTINGDVSLRETDVVLPAPGIPLVFRRSYDSRSEHTNSPVGPRWSHSYDWELSDRTNHFYGGTVADWKVLRTGGGELHWFEADTNGTYASPADADYRLTDLTNSWEVLVGGRTTYTFGTNGLLQGVADGSGNALTLTYTNSGGRDVASRIEHSNGQAIDLTYATGLLTRVGTPTNTFYMTYAYDAQGRMTGATRHASGDSHTTSYGYGALNSLTQRVNAAGDTYAYGYAFVTNADGLAIAKGTSMALNTNWYSHALSYNTESNFTVLTYHRGDTNQAYKYYYDADSLTVSAIYGPNGTNDATLYTRDGSQNPTRTKVVEGDTGDYLLTVRSFDARHNPVSEAHGYNAPPLHTWSYVWNMTNDTLLSTTDPEGDQVTFDYAGDLPVAVCEHPSAGETLTTSFGYSSNGLLVAVTNANGHWTRFGYDGNGYQTSAVPQLGPSVTYGRDVLGQVTSLSLPGAGGARTTTFDVDDLGRVLSITYPDSLSESFLYDPIGNLTNHTDRAGRTTRFAFAPTHKLTSATRGPGSEEATVSLSYDQQFNTLTIVDELGRDVEAYALDIKDRPVTVSNVESQQMSIAYSVADMVQSVTRFDGTTVTYGYDSSARLTSVLFPDGTDTFTFYDDGMLKTAVNCEGTVSNAYDGANRLTTQVGVSPSGTVSYAYWPAGQVSNVASVAGGTTYSLDTADRVSSIAADAATFAYGYDAYNGLISSVTNTQSGVFAQYAFDDMDRLTSVVWRDGTNGVLRSFAYGYDAIGKITNVARESASEDVAYGHDSLDRLASADASYLEADYYWDLAGNPTSRVEDGSTTAYILGAGNRLASWTGGSYLHDEAGCVTNVSCGATNLSLSWNSRYELVSVATNGVATEFLYGPHGRRVTTVEDGETNHQIYSGDHLLADVDADGALLRSYVAGPGVDNWLAMTVHTGATAKTYVYLTDHAGTVHALADENGAVVESYRYDPWGRVLGVWDGSGSPLGQSALGNRIMFQGREYHWSSGLYHFRARWYDPITGRWLSKDPIGISGGLNQYVAFNNNPVNFRDAFGLDAYIILRGYRGTAFNPNIGHVIVAVDMPDGSVLTRDAAKPAGDGVGMLFKSGDLRDSITYTGGIAEALKHEGATGLITFPNKKAGFLGRRTSDDILREALQEGHKGFGGGFGLYCSTYAARMLGKAGYDILEGYTPNALFESAKQYADSFNLTVDYFEDDKCKK